MFSYYFYYLFCLFICFNLNILSLSFEASETIKVCPVENSKFPRLSAIDFSSLDQGICLMMMTAQSKELGGSHMHFSTWTRQDFLPKLQQRKGSECGVTGTVFALCWGKLCIC